jgi:hypothetical protein
MVSRGWWPAAGALAGLATLYHPTTTAPFWGCAAIWFVWRGSRQERLALLVSAGVTARACWRWRRSFRRAIGGAAVLGADRRGAGGVAAAEGGVQLDWLWPKEWLWQYPLLFAVGVGAWWRVRGMLSPALRFFSLALPVYGLLMIPVTWFLLDQQKWIFMPQFQPARAVLFITAFAMILGALAAWHAAASGKVAEAAGWLALVYVLP